MGSSRTMWWNSTGNSVWGKFGLNKAFRIIEKEEGQPVIIDPIINVEHVYFKDIVGYELQKQKLIENTEAFVDGKEANNVLLFGDAGNRQVLQRQGGAQ